MRHRNNFYKWIGIVALMILFGACQEDEYIFESPEPNTHFQNDVIKRSLGPNVVGLDIEFVYAMALGFDEGGIVSAQVEASIAGAPGTYLEHRSYHTGPGGEDVGVEIGEPSFTSGGVTKVTFSGDTSAAALRYYYIVPEESRGNQVTFTFSAQATTGETVSYDMGPYTISNVDMVRDIELSNDEMNYFSIADMQAYSATEAAANADKIDLVYLHRAIAGINFNHALVAPGADPDLLPGIVLPAGLNQNTKVRRTWQLYDQHLARLQFGTYVDDLDFLELDLSRAANYAINLRGESGAWVETADGRYRAFIFINQVNNANRTMRISVKRLSIN